MKRGITIHQKQRIPRAQSATALRMRSKPSPPMPPTSASASGENPNRIVRQAISIFWPRHRHLLRPQQVRQPLVERPFHGIGLQRIASALEWIAIGFLGHPALETHKGSRMNGVHPRQGAVFSDNNFRELRRMHQLISALGLNHPKVIFGVAQADRMRVANRSSVDCFLDVKLSYMASVSDERRPRLVCPPTVLVRMR